MATFFHGPSEMETDGLQTLYLMNPGYVGYTDAQQPNMVFINPGNSSSLAHQHQQAAAPPPPPHHSHQNHHFVGIPLQATATSPSAASQHDIAAAAAVHHGFIPRLHYNLWTSIDPNSTTPTASDHLGGGGVRRSVPAQQGLSLSLYGRADSDIPTSVISPTSGDEMRVSGGGGGGGGGGSTSSASASASAVSNGTANTTTGMQSVLLGSKYLKAAQELLDEVVNVGNGIKSELSKGGKDNNQHSKASRESTVVTGHEGSNCGGESSGKRGGSADLSTAEKQELQMKKAKLVSMLDEVEQRYRQYHHQMQIVVSSFEQAAGVGSAKTYTALALQTISKQFRCLKDAIGGQIKATSKSLGEEDLLGGKGEGSRLRYVDHQLRQQRALQQLGMIQHNAWRPQRGLPERSVSILRAWLFEHFLHPYPKDSDKLMLAKQTGLTRSQVSNWFINARVRLWKPMVEEMYMEETKNEEQNGMDEKTSKNEHHNHHHHHHQVNEESGSARSSAQQENINSPIRTDQSRNHNIAADGSIDPNASMSNITVPASAMEGNIRTQGSFFLMRSPDSTTEVNNMAQGNTKKSRSNEMQDSPTSIHSIGMEMKPGEMSRDFAMKFDIERQNRNGYSLITSPPNNGGGGGGGGFGPYPIGVDIGRFDPEQFAPRFSGNGVSLTLGLPHCENLPLSGAQQSYLSSPTIQLSRGLEIGGGDANNFCGINTTPPPNSHSTAAYESINLQNRKRFAAQLLPDFVA